MRSGAVERPALPSISAQRLAGESHAKRTGVIRVERPSARVSSSMRQLLSCCEYGAPKLCGCCGRNGSSIAPQSYPGRMSPSRAPVLATHAALQLTQNGPKRLPPPDSPNPVPVPPGTPAAQKDSPQGICVGSGCV
eukprot:CAMPEP_0180306292 /NCGR_PEP_ID=MMETSP0988-20121125/26969_1 /TAXON_ID=697907 /ORGANISM="non described non described, Strain CCMP2293" /LENGTH=135 /DNA_ID=CAMNT_0022288957 /DNA_START=147 /DNA_END=555 /DNA_ORIENTATION=+